MGFDRAVPTDGYAWWYVDAVSADGAHALTIIAFVGSVFSPYYAWARRRGKGEPTNHVAMNVALYGRPARWAMTERGRSDLRRDDTGIAIGPSAMAWDGESLRITIAETTFPVPGRLRGTVTVRPPAVSDQTFALDGAGRHRWRPICPSCAVDVAFEDPALTWSGRGYFDTNDGDEPLEAAFRSWTWSRFDMGDGARIFYDVIAKDGEERRLALQVRADGVVEPAASLPYASFGSGLWRVPRAAPADTGLGPELVRVMEDAPFYTRSHISSTVDGVFCDGVHESLSLPRLTSPLVQAMLPFRMPRRARA